MKTEDLEKLIKMVLELKYLEKHGKDSYDITMKQRDILTFLKNLF